MPKEGEKKAPKQRRVVSRQMMSEIGTTIASNLPQRSNQSQPQLFNQNVQKTQSNLFSANSQAQSNVNTAPATSQSTFGSLFKPVCI